MLVVTKEGTLLLARKANLGVPVQPIVGLFQNNVFPDHNFTLADFVENSFPGYARQVAYPAVSVDPQADGSSEITWQPLNFLPSGLTAEKSYGYFVVDTDPVTLAAVLVWCERGTPTVDWAVPSTALILLPLLDLQTLFG
jgi:hypothetical protein